MASARSSSGARAPTEERVVFRHRARLFRMSAANRWTEEGTGDVKVLVHVQSGRSRLVMRKDRTMNILLNMLVNPDSYLVPASSEDANGDRAFVFEAENYATGAMERSTYALRFKTAAVAQDFQRMYAEAQDRNREVFVAEQAAANKPPTSPGSAAGGLASAAADPSSGSFADATSGSIARSASLSPAAGRLEPSFADAPAVVRRTSDMGVAAAAAEGAAQSGGKDVSAQSGGWSWGGSLLLVLAGVGVAGAIAYAAAEPGQQAAARKAVQDAAKTARSHAVRAVDALRAAARDITAAK